MLITNFAAGELSENLFGRIDIPQYFSGASRVENFDVIPTGGIKRRGGMERLAELSGEGRIIPFVVNRNEGFLLYLTNNKISTYKLVDGQITGSPVVRNSGTNLQLYKTDEIDKVQYAQNFNTMILVHENCPPLEAKFENNEIKISLLKMSFKKEIIQGTGVSDEDALIPDREDDTYRYGQLTSYNNYPSAVSFFNGRLVFASTKINRQRLFASAIKEQNEDYNFATKKVFLTEKKEYIVIYGSIDENHLNTIIIETGEGLKFTAALEEYYVETFFFPPTAKIVKLQGDMLIMSEDANITLPLKQTALDEIEDMIRDAVTRDAFPSAARKEILQYKVGVGYVTLPGPGGPGSSGSATVMQFKWQHIFMTPGATMLKVDWYTEDTDGPFSDGEIIYDLDIKAVLLYENDPLYYENFVREQLRVRGFWLAVSEPVVFENVVNEVIQSLKNNSLEAMKYILDLGDCEETYYNKPEEIKRVVERRCDNAKNIYIPFYTREILKDEYPTPDCGFTFEIASDMNDAIKWLAVNKGLIVGTEAAEWIIPPGVHATNVQAVLNSRYGSDGIQGTAIGDATCFFQAGKKALVEYYIPQQDNNFRANNMALLSAQMLQESSAKEFDFVSSPYIKLIVTREDGTAVSLLYERGTGTFAWSRIITEGKICSTAVLPGADGNDDLYLVVMRYGEFFLEVLREGCNVFLDSFIKLEFSFANNPAYSDKAVIEDSCIGYPYTSMVRSMPILANDKMKPNNIKNITIRFLDSFMPKLKALPNEKVDVITKKEPFSGVHKVPFPGVWDHDVCFEFIHDTPNRCRILAINAEVN